LNPLLFGTALVACAEDMAIRPVARAGRERMGSRR